MAKPRITIALAGNPNCGKTTVFNALTGDRQHVGNYPGVTVEYKEGSCEFGGHKIRVVDLPGTYSLTAHTLDEVVARNFVVDEHPDVVVDIVDASNLERNLYLATQFLELNVPLVLAFNMSDVARSNGLKFDYEQLSELLRAPIVATVGHRREGIDELLETIVRVATTERERHQHMVHYGLEIQTEIGKLQPLLTEQPGLEKYPARWLVVKLLEGDEEVRAKLLCGGPDMRAVLDHADRSIEHLHKIYGEMPEVIIAEARYGFISGACEEAVESTVQARHDMSDHIDMVLTHPLLGIPVFLILMWLVFQITFTVGKPPMEWIEALFGAVARMLVRVLPDGHLQSVLVDGVIHGLGGVLVFLPNILLLFFCIAFLEDSGYMARGAFIMDRIMHKIGLHGRSFIPLLIGFGCSVPAVMATRTLENRRDRLVTMLVVPLMSCGARLPIYVLLAGAFFGPVLDDNGHVLRRSYEANAIFSLYVIGIVVAVIMAKVFRKFLLTGLSTPFVMELPPYRLPTVRAMFAHTWERGWMYLRKAATIILAVSVVMWALSTFPAQPKLEAQYSARIGPADAAEAQLLAQELAAKKLERSFTGHIGRAIAPLLKPAGLGNWKTAAALFAGLGAKEIVVSTMGTLHSLGETDARSKALQSRLKGEMTALQAYALMVFVLLYIPCLATVVIIKKETDSWRWPLFAVAYTTVLAWTAATVIYQGGCLLGLNV